MPRFFVRGHESAWKINTRSLPQRQPSRVAVLGHPRVVEPSSTGREPHGSEWPGRRTKHYAPRDARAHHTMPAVTHEVTRLAVWGAVVSWFDGSMVLRQARLALPRPTISPFHPLEITRWVAISSGGCPAPASPRIVTHRVTWSAWFDDCARQPHFGGGTPSAPMPA